MRILTIMVAVVGTGSAFAQAPVYDLSGHASDQFGQTVAWVGDLDLDGHDDFAIGAPFGPGLQPGSGYVNVCSSRTGSVLFQFQGQRTGDHYGWAIAGLGDVNGDGVGDLAIGAPLHEWVEALPGVDNGAVYMLSGANGALIRKFGGVNDESWLGWSLAALGDVDGDGVNDLAMGEPGMDQGADNEIGRVAVLSGATQTHIQSWVGQVAGDYFGYAMACVGDVNGDSRPDLVVGAPYFNTAIAQDAGRAYLLKVTQPPSAAVILSTGGTAGGHLAFSVAGGFDFNADGIGDFALGEPHYKLIGQPIGRVRVFTGVTQTIAQTINGTGDDQLGYSVAGLADVDGDGHGDLIAGAPGGDVGANVDFGLARVYSGATWQPVFEVVGYHADERMGHSVASAGLLNADGSSDILCGANSSDLHGTNSGRARVVLGNAEVPSSYCTAKLNSQACAPYIFFTGCPSASIGDNFHIQAAEVLPNKVGLMIWSLSAAATPFFGGTLCLGAPVRRTQGQIASVQPGAVNCQGGYDFHFSHAYMAAQSVAAGDQLYAQYWSRDGGFTPPNNVGLTNALKFLILP